MKLKHIKLFEQFMEDDGEDVIFQWTPFKNVGSDPIHDEVPQTISLEELVFFLEEMESEGKLPKIGKAGFFQSFFKHKGEIYKIQTTIMDPPSFKIEKSNDGTKWDLVEDKVGFYDIHNLVNKLTPRQAIDSEEVTEAPEVLPSAPEKEEALTCNLTKMNRLIDAALDKRDFKEVERLYVIKTKRFPLAENKGIKNLALLEKFISEQKTGDKYAAVGTKMIMFGACSINIRVVEKESSKIISAKGKDGEEKDIKKLYDETIKSIQKDLADKKITGVKLPAFNELKEAK